MTAIAGRVVAVAAWKAVAGAILAAVAGAALAWGYQTIGERARAPIAAEMARLRASIETANQSAADRAAWSTEREDRNHADLLERIAGSQAATDRVLADLAATGPDFERRLRGLVADAVSRVRRASVPPATAGVGDPAGDGSGGVAGPDDRGVATVARRLAAIADRAAIESARLAQCRADLAETRRVMQAGQK